MTITTRHVIFGTGAIGLATLDSLRSRGETVRLVNRSGHAPVADDVEVVGGDAADPAFTTAVSAGACVVYQTRAPVVVLGAGGHIEILGGASPAGQPELQSGATLEDPLAARRQSESAEQAIEDDDPAEPTQVRSGVIGGLFQTCLDRLPQGGRAGISVHD
jgi:hypothetical protein